MLATFKARAEAVSAEVVHCAGKSQAVEEVVALLAREGVADQTGARAVWADGPLVSELDRAALASRVPGLTFEVTKEAAAGARVGVTQADYGIAATGTLVVDSARAGGRSAGP